MTKCLVVGDPHAKVSNIQEIRDLKSAIIKEITAHRPDFVAILGDLVDTFEKIHVQAWNSVLEFMVDIAKEAPVYYVVGNHDYLNNSQYLTDNHFFNAFKHFSGLPIKIIDRPTRVEGFLFCPYVFPGKFMDAVSHFIKSDIKAIFCHQEFFGAKMGAIESKIGDKWGADNPLVISGHIHDRQWLQPNVFYVGAPHHTSFGDHGEKTISLFVFKDKDFSEVPINLGLPKKVTLYTNATDFDTLIVPDNSKCRIFITDTAEKINLVKKTKKFKDLSKTHKIIDRQTERASIKRNKDGLSYMRLLGSYVNKETDTVKKMFDEINNEN